MSRKLYCPKCHGSLVKSDVAGLIEELFEQKNGKLVFELEKVREKEKTNPEKIKKIQCYNCKRKLRYFVEEE